MTKVILQAVVLDQGLEPDLVADIQRFLDDLINAGVRKQLISLIKVVGNLIVFHVYPF